MIGGDDVPGPVDHPPHLGARLVVVQRSWPGERASRRDQVPHTASQSVRSGAGVPPAISVSDATRSGTSSARLCAMPPPV
ncbi:hypothetical protein FHX81_6446 [Saccharothrix saharensis]|uniref:Uncharacterized protein n=1 Tax=Saccharothrix saharensis TaxID=571190 RepID=A0A543JME2_9PSEU|nr:hypothetical protein FHX81_6446 [Saccharothrix saharensis]